ncbi:MFS transporter, partial [Oceanospirillum sp. HFRX-1_2]
GAEAGAVPDGKAALFWVALLALIPAGIALMLQAADSTVAGFVLIAGLLLFGAVFAINSSLHSYLIVSYARDEGVSMDVGFYYMANAAGRLLGTVLSGWLYQAYGEGAAGLVACLWVSAAMLVLTALISIALPRHQAV